jgi:hypothetical protein
VYQVAKRGGKFTSYASTTTSEVNLPLLSSTSVIHFTKVRSLGN